jgi:hypothetical protein
MKLAGDMEQRLRAAIHRALFRSVRAPDAVRVEETENDGRADVQLTPPEGTLCIEWKIQRISIGEDPPAPEDAEDLETVRRQFDWDGDVVHLPDFSSPIPHRKLALDQRDGIGVGTFPLHAATSGGATA